VTILARIKQERIIVVVVIIIIIIIIIAAVVTTIIIIIIITIIMSLHSYSCARHVRDMNVVFSGFAHQLAIFSHGVPLGDGYIC
jgi:hypothetical protein